MLEDFLVTPPPPPAIHNTEVWSNSELIWYTTNICKKLNYSFYDLRKLICIGTQATLLSAHCGIFESVLTYGTSKQNWDGVFVPQKTALRTVWGLHSVDSCTEQIRVTSRLNLAVTNHLFFCQIDFFYETCFKPLRPHLSTR